MLKKQPTKFKISIIGSGFVGSTIAYALMLKNIADEIILIDKNKHVAIAEQLDLSCSLKNICNCNIYAGDYSDIKDSDIIIVACGRSRKPNETRLNMVNDNIKIAKNVANEINRYYNKGLILIVSNPVDIVTYKMTQWLNLPYGKVFGSGCTLDTLRFKNVISNLVGNCDKTKVEAMVVGEHGESQVPLWSRVKVNNVNLETYCAIKNIKINEKIKQNLAQQVITMGSKIITGKGRTNYGIATCMVNIIGAIKNDKKQILSLSSVLKGEYGIEDVALSLPSVVGKNGIETVCIETFNSLEQQMLYKSSVIIKNTLENLKKEQIVL